MCVEVRPRVEGSLTAVSSSGPLHNKRHAGSRTRWAPDAGCRPRHPPRPAMRIITTRQEVRLHRDLATSPPCTFCGSGETHCEGRRARNATAQEKQPTYRRQHLLNLLLVRGVPQHVTHSKHDAVAPHCIDYCYTVFNRHCHGLLRASGMAWRSTGTKDPRWAWRSTDTRKNQAGMPSAGTAGGHESSRLVVVTGQARRSYLQQDVVPQRGKSQSRAHVHRVLCCNNDTVRDTTERYQLLPRLHRKAIGNAEPGHMRVRAGQQDTSSLR
jgi:hypothetical protein